MDLSVLIVSYNTSARTLECLRSLEREARGLSHEILLLDNASQDDSVARIREHDAALDIDAQPENLGFARGVNRLARRARGEFLLLLNPDTVVLAGALQELLTFARAQPDLAIAGGRTRKPDGTPDPGFAWGRPTPWSTFCLAIGLATLFPRSAFFNAEGVGQRLGPGAHEVDIVSGCFMLVPRALWEQLGGFDPDFFMYGEDADLCLRARQHGNACRVTSKAVVLHHGGASEKGLAAKQHKLLAAKRRLMTLHWTRTEARLGAGLLQLHALLRATSYTLLALVRPGLASRAGEWREVWRNRSRWLASSPPPSDGGANSPESMKGSRKPALP